MTPYPVGTDVNYLWSVPFSTSASRDLPVMMLKGPQWKLPEDLQGKAP
jgi:hypothetical protein